MTPLELKRRHLERRPDSHFFDSDTMVYFGDTMRNYGVRQATMETCDGPLPLWELYRKAPVKHGRHSSAYFRQDTFEYVVRCTD